MWLKYVQDEYIHMNDDIFLRPNQSGGWGYVHSQGIVPSLYEHSTSELIISAEGWRKSRGAHGRS